MKIDALTDTYENDWRRLFMLPSGLADPGGDWVEAVEAIRRMLPAKAERLHRVGPMKFQPALYALVRMVEPEVVVETGVYNGVSTVIILKAMRDIAMENNHFLGQLYSFDPDDRTGAGRIKSATGVDPHDLWPHGWIYRRERGISGIPSVTEPINMFVHDSDAAARNMDAELRAVEGRLAPGAVIVANGWKRHQAGSVWPDWCKEHGIEFIEFGTAAIALWPNETVASVEDPAESPPRPEPMTDSEAREVIEGLHGHVESRMRSDLAKTSQNEPKPAKPFEPDIRPDLPEKSYWNGARYVKPGDQDWSEDGFSAAAAGTLRDAPEDAGRE